VGAESFISTFLTVAEFQIESFDLE